MMGLAKQTGAKPEEISAVAWAIMAYRRIQYDHTKFPDTKCARRSAGC